MKTTNILNWAASLNMDDLVLDAQLANIVADDLLMMRSIEVLDLAVAMQIDNFSFKDFSNFNAG